MFERLYTRDQLNRGEGMRFHPVCGLLLKDLHYNSALQCFCSPVSFQAGGWSLDSERVTPRYACIGDERELYKRNDVYPQHWVYDPWSGREVFPYWTC